MLGPESLLTRAVEAGARQAEPKIAPNPRRAGSSAARRHRNPGRRQYASSCSSPTHRLGICSDASRGFGDLLPEGFNGMAQSMIMGFQSCDLILHGQQRLAQLGVLPLLRLDLLLL